MGEPIVLIDRSAVRDGRLDELKVAMTELSDFVASSGTRAIAYDMYLSDDDSQMTVVQIHPDSESVEAQMAAAAHVFAKFRDLLTMQSMDIYGRPSESLTHVLRRKADLLGLGSPPIVHALETGFRRY
jgi:hypothetical protein